MPLTATEEAAIGDVLGGTIPGTTFAIDTVTSWSDAARFLRLTEHDSSWWDVEESEREVLWERAAQQWSEADLLQQLNAATAALHREIHDAALEAASAEGPTDASIVREASDMALLATHQCALARLAGASAEHPFVRKHALFAGGRWPLGYHAARFAIF